MKFKTTKKEIMRGFGTIISIGYCNAQHLLYFEEPVAYTSSKEGWGADIYQVNGGVIVTGYSPFGNVKPDYDTIRKYDAMAETVCIRTDLDWDVRKEMISGFIKEFISEVTK